MGGAVGTAGWRRPRQIDEAKCHQRPARPLCSGAPNTGPGAGEKFHQGREKHRSRLHSEGARHHPTKGFRGLFEALDAGVALPAALLPIAVGAVAASQQKSDE